MASSTSIVLFIPTPSCLTLYYLGWLIDSDKCFYSHINEERDSCKEMESSKSPLVPAADKVWLRHVRLHELYHPPTETTTLPLPQTFGLHCGMAFVDFQSLSRLGRH